MDDIPHGDGTPFAGPFTPPLRPATTVATFGRTLVVAPHPDDESLGCGGAIALLTAMGAAVRVLFVTDGALSHPGSRRYPAPALRALREREAYAALAALGVGADDALFMRLRDRETPVAGTVGFERALALCRAQLDLFAPETILLPWRRDPHPDHRAAAALMRTAVAQTNTMPRFVEYPIWLWMLAREGDPPGAGEIDAWRLDIAAALPRKQAAIAAHRSQTTDLIDDDPEGFRLTPEMLAHFAHPWELYFG